MNRYPLWKYITMFVVVLIAAIYALPNYFGEAPAVQVSPAKATAAIDEPLKQRALAALATAQLQPTLVEQQGNSLLLRFDNTNTQIKARDVVDTAVNEGAQEEPGYSVALNLVSRSPQWLRALRASPMFLGLDLRGGVHFTLQVDVQSALGKRLDALALDARNQLRQKNIAVADVKRTENGFVVAFADETTLDAAQPVLQDGTPELQWTRGGEQVAV